MPAHGPFVVSAFDLCQHIAALCFTGFYDAIEPSALCAADHFLDDMHALKVRFNGDAGLARLGDFDHRTAQAEAVADTDFAFE